METSSTTIDAVIAIGIGLHVELVVVLDECFGEFSGVLEVNVVISKSMNEEEVTMNALVAMER